MSFLILLLFALDSRVLGFSYMNYASQNLNEAEVVNYNEMGGGICPKNKDPLCATNGQEFLYFENKCLLEVMNFEQLLQGLSEYYECALSYCNIDCAPCEKIHEPVCAIELLTGKLEDFLNPCEVNRRICTTQKDYSIISSGQCISEPKSQYGCPVFCSLEYNPVCAQFNKELREFANSCELQKEICETKKNWQIVNIYECNSIVQKDIFIPFNSPPPNSECPEWCTLEYRPICARFMTLENEFANECELKVTICKTKQKWDIIRHGPCQESNEYKDLQPTPKCTEFCPVEFSPVCAKFQSELKEFSDKCQLESLICKTGEDWQIIYEGPCSVFNESQRCTQFCTADYKPICAKLNNEFREFSNSCVLGRTICETNEKWVVVHHKNCQLIKKPKCPDICTLEYSPICAKFKNELREFGNKCNLLREICETKKEWEVVNLGTCSSSSCPKVCTTDYDPVCAKLDNEFREFSNKCVLESWNCKSDKKWELFSTGTCAPIQSYYMSSPNICPKFCTREYNPVCAIMGNELKEFSNECVLNSWNCESKENWEIVYFGPCALDSHNYPPQLSNCPQFCTRDYRPVCAQFNFELKEFPNKCEFLRANCESKKTWKIVSLGPCSSSNLPQSYSKAATSKILNCPEFCTKEYNPVCAKFGSELREFGNECDLRKTICETNADWYILYRGTCRTTYSATTTLKDIYKSTPKVQAVDERIYFTTDTPPKKFINTYTTATTTPKTTEKPSYTASAITTSKTSTKPEYTTVKTITTLETTVRPKYTSKPTTTTTLETTTETVNYIKSTTTNKPIYTTHVYTTVSTTPKTTEKPSYTAGYITTSKTTTKPEYTTASLETTVKPKYTSNPATTTPLENTTTTETVNYIKTSTTNKPIYATATTPKTITATTTSSPRPSTTGYMHSSEDYSTESDNNSTGYYEDTYNDCGCSNEDNAYYSEEDTDDETYHSSEEMDHEEDEISSRFYETHLANTTDNNAYSNNYNDTESTSNSAYGEVSTETYEKYSYENKASEETYAYKNDGRDPIYTIAYGNGTTETYEKYSDENNPSEGAYSYKDDAKDPTYTIAYGNDATEKYEGYSDKNNPSKETYTYKNDDKDSTYTIAYGNDSSETYEKYSDENNASEGAYSYKDDGKDSTYTSAYGNGITETYEKYSDANNPSDGTYSYKDDVKDPTYTIAYGNGTTETYEKYSDANNPSDGTYSYKDDVKDPTYTIAYGNDFSQTYEGYSIKNNTSQATYSHKNDGKDSTYTIAFVNDPTESYEKYSNEYNPSDGTNSYKNDTIDPIYTFAYGEDSTETYKEYLNENNPSEGTYSYKNDAKVSTYTFAYGKDSTETYKEYSDQNNPSEETYSYNSGTTNPLYTIANGNDFTETYKGYMDANNPSKKILPYQSNAKDPIYTFTYGNSQTETYNSEDSYTYKHKDSGSSYTFIKEQDSTKSYDSSTEEASKENMSEKSIYMEEKKYPNDFKYKEDHTSSSHKEAEVRRADTDTQTMTGESYENYSNTAKLIYTKVSKVKQQNQADESQYDNDRKSKNYIELNSHNNIQTYLPVTKYPSIQSSDQNNNAVKYSTQTETNYSDNTENILEVFESLLTKSDEEEEDDETLVKQVLTTNYPTYDDIETPLNYTKNNFTSNKKEEIYNGVVYKAPVYDAPTYNFIYTAPNHPVIPYNYPGIVPNYGRTAQNSYNPFVPISNQSNAEIAAEFMPGGTIPFNPLQFLYSLAAMSRTGSATPNLMHAPPVMDYGSNIPTVEYNQQEPPTTPILSDLKLPSSSFNSPVYKQILTQTHPLPQMFLPPPPEQVLSPLYSHYAHPISNLLHLPQNGKYENNKQPTDNNPINGLTNIPPHPFNMPYFYPPMPPQMPPPTAPVPYNSFNAPQISFNSTLFNQIVETLKTIVSRH